MGGSASKYKVKANNASDDAETGAQEFGWIANAKIKLTLKSDAFENVKGIGKGKFGIVFLSKQTIGVAAGKYVAIKYISKQIIHECKAIGRIQQEINVLQQLDHPFAIKCLGGFQNSAYVALVLDFAYGGELYHRLKQMVKFSEEEARFYFLEIAAVLRYLQQDLGLVYRDLKPENILLDHSGHVKLADFGFATSLASGGVDGEETGLRDTVGTAMYLSPEVVCSRPHGAAVDWWALGVLLFEMVTGDAPFGDSDQISRFEIFNNISEKNPRLPLLQGSALRSLLKGLLIKEPKARFGWKDVCSSPWVAQLAWSDVNQRKLLPPWIPVVSKPGSTENFVNWSLTVPGVGGAGLEAENYCSVLRMPSPPVKANASPVREGDVRRQASSASQKAFNRTMSQSQSTSDKVPSPELQLPISSPSQGLGRRRSSAHISEEKESPKLERKLSKAQSQGLGLSPLRAQSSKVLPSS